MKGLNIWWSFIFFSGEIVFEYGVVGHDMPFHGVGPLAKEILEGECFMKSIVGFILLPK